MVPGRFIVFVVALATASTVAAAASDPPKGTSAGEPVGSGSPQTPESGTEEDEGRSERGRSPDTFTPSEQIGAETSVPFPADI